MCNEHGTITRYLKKFGDQQQIQEWRNIYGIKASRVNSSTDTTVVHLPKEFISLRKNTSDPYRNVAYNYLKSRGIDDYLIQRYNIGYAVEGKYNNRVIFPSYDSAGQVNFFTSRAIYEANGLKYLMPRANRNTLIFNEMYLDFSAPVIITEGVFDSLRLENSVPLLGSTLSKHSRLFKKLVQFKPITYVALDADAKSKAVEIMKLLASWNVQCRFVDLSKWEDLAEVPREELPTLFADCLSANFEHQIMLGLN